MIERIALTLGRCLLGLYFLVPGLSKITGYSGTLAYMQLHNVPFSDLLLPVTNRPSGWRRTRALVGLSHTRYRPDVGWVNHCHQYRHARFLEYVS